MRNVLKIIGSGIGSISLGVFLLYSIAVVGNHVTTPHTIALIIDTRTRVKDGEQNDKLTGLVTRCNQRIANYQEYNKCWWADIAVPDAWDDVERIKWPEESHD